MLQALIYTRVSEDRAGGRSPAEQEADARTVCEREGWDVTKVITDTVGASRYSKGKRTGWEEAKRLIASRKVDVLVTWAASRAQRDLAAYAELRDLCAANGVRWCYQGRVYDLAAKDDRFTTGLDALLAERDSAEISMNVRRAVRANAAAGRPHGRRLYGYERVYDPATGFLTTQEPHPTEAPVVQRIFAEYLAGLGYRTIARHLNNEGITTGTGGKWVDGQVKRVLENPAYVARRVHRGEVVADAVWTPIVDKAAWERTQALIADRSTRTTRYSGTARLLTGVGRCGICGGKIAAIHDHNIRKVYVCKDRFEVARDLKKLDAYVADALLKRLREHAHAPAADEGEAEAMRAERDAYRARLDDAVDQYAAGKLSATTLARIEAKVLPAIADLDKQLRATTGPTLDLAVPADHDAAWKWWDALEPERKRAIVGAYVAAVSIYPTRRGVRTFNPDAVQIEFR